MKRVHLIIAGDVQGVGFRAWVSKLASKIGLRGWVKNRQDGAVEVTAEGQHEKLLDFATQCHLGPDVAWVESVDETWSDATGEFAEFEVVY